MKLKKAFTTSACFIRNLKRFCSHIAILLTILCIPFSSVANNYIPESFCTNTYYKLKDQSVSYIDGPVVTVNNEQYLFSTVAGLHRFKIKNLSDTIIEYTSLKQQNTIIDTTLPTPVLGMDTVIISLPTVQGGFKAVPNPTQDIKRLNANEFSFQPSPDQVKSLSTKLLFISEAPDSTVCYNTFAYRMLIKFSIPDSTCIDYSSIGGAIDTQTEKFVCGCNGKTYKNASIAKNKYGVQLYNNSACTEKTILDELIPYDTICINKESTISVQDTFSTYQWSNGTTQADITPKRPGQYFITATDKNGFEYFDSFFASLRDTFKLNNFDTIQQNNWNDRILINLANVSMPFKAITEFGSISQKNEGSNLLITHNGLHAENGSMQVKLFPAPEVSLNRCILADTINISYKFSPPTESAKYYTNKRIEISDVYSPVCGRDTVTYWNWEEAQFRYGIADYFLGSCEESAIISLSDTMCAGSIDLPGWDSTKFTHRLVVDGRRITNHAQITKNTKNITYSYTNPSTGESFKYRGSNMPIIDRPEPPTVRFDAENGTINAEKGPFSIIWKKSDCDDILDRGLIYNCKKTPNTCRYRAFNSIDGAGGCLSEEAPIAFCVEPSGFYPFAEDSVCVSNIDSLQLPLGFVDYQWNDGAQTLNHSANPGLHVAKVTTEKGLEFSDTIYIASHLANDTTFDTIDILLGTPVPLHKDKGEPVFTQNQTIIQEENIYIPSADDARNKTTSIQYVKELHRTCTDTAIHIQTINFLAPDTDDCFNVNMLNHYEGLQHWNQSADSVCGICTNISYVNADVAKKLFGQNQYTLGGCNETPRYSPEIIKADTLCAVDNHYTLRLENSEHTSFFIDEDSLLPERMITPPIDLSLGRHILTVQHDGALIQDSFFVKESSFIELTDIRDTAIKGQRKTLTKLDDETSVILSISSGTLTGTKPITFMAEEHALNGDIATAQILPVNHNEACINYNNATYSLYIEVIEELIFTGIISHPENPLSKDGSISISIDSGNPPYIYAWSNGSTSETITDLSQGTYMITITDAKGKSEIKSFQLIAEDERLFSLSGNISDKDHSPANATVYAFLLKNGSITASFQTKSKNGTFSFSDILPGSYYLLAVPNDKERYEPAYYSQAELFTDAFLVPATSDIIDIDILLDAKSTQEQTGTASIEGTISIANEAVGDSVFANLENYGVNIPVMLTSNDTVFAITLTGENGQFLFDGLPEGEYNVFANLPDAGNDRTTVVLSANNQKEEVEIELITALNELSHANTFSISPNPIKDGTFTISGPPFKAIALYSIKGELLDYKGYQKNYSVSNQSVGPVILVVFPEVGVPTSILLNIQ